MEIVWYDAKRELNIKNHGFDLAEIVHFDWSSVTYRPAYTGRFGNRRFKAIGFLQDDLVAAVFSGLGTEAVSLISLRRASRMERREYEQSQTHS